MPAEVVPVAGQVLALAVLVAVVVVVVIVPLHQLLELPIPVVEAEAQVVVVARHLHLHQAAQAGPALSLLDISLQTLSIITWLGVQKLLVAVTLYTRLPIAAH